MPPTFCTFTQDSIQGCECYVGHWATISEGGQQEVESKPLHPHLMCGQADSLMRLLITQILICWNINQQNINPAGDIWITCNKPHTCMSTDHSDIRVWDLIPSIHGFIVWNLHIKDKWMLTYLSLSCRRAACTY